MEIDRILEGLQVDLDPFALCEVHGAATLGLDGQPSAILHYILAGGGQIAVGNRPPITIGRGTLVLVPAYRPHRLIGGGPKGEPLPACRPLDASMALFKVGQGSGGLAAVCGRLDVSYRGVRSALDLLRAPLIEDLPPGDRVRNALDELVMELANPTVGTKALARSLLEQCLIILLRRRHLAGDPDLAWITGAADESLWQALQIILDRPSGAHTVESLADEVNMSRAVFAKRFREVFARGPIDLLRNVRLSRASELLALSDQPVKRIAELVGYRSRSTFTRTFRAEFGLSPDRFRRKARQ